MKISIWQQFSSNHSADFEVVGKFKTVEQAQAAAATLRDIIERVGDDYRQKHTQETLGKLKTKTLSNLEYSVKTEYHIQHWNHILDWTFFDLPDDTVQNFDHLVFVSNYSQTWAGYEPFDQLMRLLGGETVCGHEAFDSAYVSLNCMAPDKSFAEKVVQDVNPVVLWEDDLGSLSEITVPGTDWRIAANVSQDKARLRFYDLLVVVGDISEYQRDTASVLQKLVTYLKAHGCTNFEYDIYTA